MTKKKVWGQHEMVCWEGGCIRLVVTRLVVATGRDHQMAVPKVVATNSHLVVATGRDHQPGAHTGMVKIYI